MVAALLLSLAPVYAHGEELVHVVAKRDTLIHIAKRYHTTVDALREVNNLKPWQQIHPGLPLVIPEKGKEAEAAKRAEKIRKEGYKPSKSNKKDDKGKKDDPKSKKLDPKGKKGAAKGKKAAVDDTNKGTYARKPKRPGHVRLVRGSETLDIQILTRRGKLLPSALPKISKILRFFPTDQKIAIDPRLVTLIGIVSDHFGGRPLRVVSGYRPYSPAQYTPRSNHNHGRAMDFSVEGVPNTVLRDFCRTFRNAGVGYYPNSSFVHMDVRSVKTYWIDYSRPGEAPRYDRAHGSGHADEAARDVEPHPGAADGTPPGSEDDSGS